MKELLEHQNTIEQVQKRNAIIGNDETRKLQCKRMALQCIRTCDAMKMEDSARAGQNKPTNPRVFWLVRPLSGRMHARTHMSTSHSEQKMQVGRKFSNFWSITRLCLFVRSKSYHMPVQSATAASFAGVASDDQPNPILQIKLWD